MNKRHIMQKQKKKVTFQCIITDVILQKIPISIGLVKYLVQ